MPRPARHNYVFIYSLSIMGSSITKNLVAFLVLIVLAFLVGIMAADSAKSAALIIFGIAGLAGVVAMGRHVWMLMFILVPIGQAVPVYQLPWYFVFIAVLLIYWCILAVVGHARFTWRKMPGADLFVFAFLAYMVVTIFRHPASSTVINNFLGIKTDLVTTGLEYPLTFAVLFFYIAYSCIPFENKNLLKIIHWGVILKLILLFVTAIAGYNTQVEETNVNVFFNSWAGERVRFGMFTTFATNLCVFVYASAPFRQILQSPTKLFLILLSVVLVVFSGYRNRLLRLGLIMIGVLAIKKEYILIFTCFFTAAFSILFINQTNLIDSLPYTIQRTLAGVPGVKVDSRIKNETSGSNEWRYVMWRWALDPRTNYIRDYVWGDGCTMNVREHARTYRAAARGTYDVKSQENQAFIRAWHSGFIATIQELGIVGLCLTFIGHIYGFVMTIRIGTALRKTPYLKYFLVYTCALLQNIITFYILPASTQNFLINLAYFSFLKVFYHIGMDNGYITSHQHKGRYTPLLIKEEAEA